MKINWDSEVLSSVSKVVDQLEHLSINKDSIESVANWLAYEEFPMPSSAAVRDDADDFIRATMFMNTLNFAFTEARSNKPQDRRGKFCTCTGRRRVIKACKNTMPYQSKLI